MRTGVAEVVYGAVEDVFDSDRHHETGVPHRGDGVLVSMLQLVGAR
jgi:hypothetical protein